MQDDEGAQIIRFLHLKALPVTVEDGGEDDGRQRRSGLAEK